MQTEQGVPAPAGAQQPSPEGPFAQAPAAAPVATPSPDPQQQLVSVSHRIGMTCRARHQGSKARDAAMAWPG